MGHRDRRRAASSPAPRRTPSTGLLTWGRWDTVPEPRGSVSKPRGSVPEPRGSVTKPRGSVPEPRGSVPEPRGSVPKPWGSVPKPLRSRGPEGAAWEADSTPLPAGDGARGEGSGAQRESLTASASPSGL